MTNRAYLCHVIQKRAEEMKKRVFAFIAFALLLWIVWPYWGVKFSTHPKVHEGDVIFQNSTSDQSPLVALATGSPLTHCGIIVMKGEEPYVLEASSTLKTTPLKEFIRRGRFGAYWLKHPKEHDGSLKVRYRHLLGRSYDWAFSFDNNRYYCSELVYDIYKYQFNVQLCKPRPLKDYFTLGMKRKMRRRGMDLNGLAVAPVDLFKSDCF